MSYDNTNSGVLFKNKRKEKDSHPDITGSANVDGKEYWVSVWVKEKNGERFQSMSFRPKDEKAAPKPAAKPQAAPQLDDEIPFD